MKLPEGWKIGFVRDLIGSMDAGVSVNSTEKTIHDGESGVLKTSCVTNGTFDPTENKVIVESEIDRAKVKPKRGRILMSRMNTPLLVGASAYVPTDYENLFLPDRLWQLEPKNDLVNMKWLSYVLSSTEYRLKISSIATGTSKSMKNISKDDIRSLRLSIPPISEQQAIAELLSAWDSAIQKIDQLITAKETRINLLYYHFFRSDSKHGLNWRSVKIQEVVTSRDEKAIPDEECPLFSLTIENGVTPKTDRYNREFLVADVEAKVYKVVHPGDIVFNPANLRWGAIARSNIEHKVVVSPIYEVLKIEDDRINPEFLAHALTNPRQIAIYATKTQGTLIERMAVNLDAFLKCEIRIPPLKIDQQRIADCLDTAKNEINLLKKQKDALRAQKRGLMQKLLTGAWRVKVGAN